MILFDKPTEFPETYHYVPALGWSSSAFTVIRAGTVKSAQDYRIERTSYPGQDILFCVSGKGFVMSEGRTTAVEANTVAWLANEFPHAHWADQEDPWTVHYVRIDGPDCATVRRKVFDGGITVRTVSARGAILKWYSEVFAVLRERMIDVDLHLNRLVSELLHVLAASELPDFAPSIPTKLLILIEKMQKSPELPWEADSLSDIMGLSPAQMRRLFQKHLQISPRGWLIRERIMMAQRLLLSTQLSLAQVAEKCGFVDAYHLSREFKRRTGVSPGHWRDEERKGQMRSL